MKILIKAKTFVSKYIHRVYLLETLAWTELIRNYLWV